MCDWLSALVVSNGDVLTHPMLDSHVDLATYFKLPDENVQIPRFVKVELVPQDWTDVSTWNWKIDQDTLPAWWSDVANQAEATLRARADKMILRDGEHALIVDGCWIVAGTAKVRDVRSGRIMRVQGSAQIHDVWGSAQIHGVGGSAQIHGVGGSAQIHGVGGSAQIHDVGGSAQIHDVGGSAQIHDVWGSAQIHGVWGSAQLEESAKRHVVEAVKGGAA